MLKCPFCAEEIQDEARKCKHCGEWLVSVPDQPDASNLRKISSVQSEPHSRFLFGRLILYSIVGVLIGVVPSCIASNIYIGVQAANDPAFKILLETCRETPGCRTSSFNFVGYVALAVITVGFVMLKRRQWHERR